MAGMISGSAALPRRVPGIPEQVALVRQLRWQLFRNSLRTLKGRLEVVALLISGLFLTGGVLGAGIGLGVWAFVLLQNNEVGWLAALFWIVFLFWHLFPLILAASTPQFDFRNLLRFPLRYSVFCILSLAYGLFDASAVVSLFWLACIAGGILMARPALVLWAAPVMLVFAAMNLTLGRTIFAWLDRWLARRRTREVVAFFILILAICSQFLGVFAARWSRSTAPTLVRLAPLVRFLPPGLAGQSLADLANGHILEAVGCLAVLALYFAFFLWLLGLRLRAQFRGEDLGEAPAVVVAPAARVVRPAWSLPGIPAPVMAVLEKEVRYMFRSGAGVLNLIVPFIVLLFLLVPMGHAGQHAGFLRGAPDFIFPAAIGYAFLIQASVAYNCFAFDAAGIQFLFVAPVGFRDVLAGKNLFQAGVMLVQVGLIGALVSWMARPPSLLMLLVTLAALLFASLLNFSAGNMLSLYFPRKFEFGAFRQRRVSGITVLMSLFLQVVLFGFCAGVFLLARFLGWPWLAAGIFLILAAGAWPLYRTGLRRCDRLALEKREVLTAELCRQ
jgi:ABC-2 type transport system permease protein